MTSNQWGEEEIAKIGVLRAQGLGYHLIAKQFPSRTVDATKAKIKSLESQKIISSKVDPEQIAFDVNPAFASAEEIQQEKERIASEKQLRRLTDQKPGLQVT